MLIRCEILPEIRFCRACLCTTSPSQRCHHTTVVVTRALSSHFSSLPVSSLCPVDRCPSMRALLSDIRCSLCLGTRRLTLLFKKVSGSHEYFARSCISTRDTSSASILRIYGSQSAVCSADRVQCWPSTVLAAYSAGRPCRFARASSAQFLGVGSLPSLCELFVGR